MRGSFLNERCIVEAQLAVQLRKGRIGARVLHKEMAGKHCRGLLKKSLIFGPDQRNVNIIIPWNKALIFDCTQSASADEIGMQMKLLADLPAGAQHLKLNGLQLIYEGSPAF